MAIRKSTAQDLTQLRQIYNNSRAQHFYWEQPNNYQLEDFDEHSSEEIVIVAEEGATLLGFLSLSEKTNYIHLLFIKPGCEGRGVGKQLLNYIKESTGATLTLKCVKRNESALNFYKRFGFQIVEEGIDDYGTAFFRMAY